MTNVLFSRDRSDRRSRLDRNTRRLREIVSVAVRYRLADVVDPKNFTTEKYVLRPGIGWGHAGLRDLEG